MRESAGDGEALLLTAGEFRAEGVESILDLFPERCLPKAFLDELVEACPVQDPGHATQG